MGIPGKIMQLAQRLAGGPVPMGRGLYQDKLEAVNALEPNYRQASQTQLRRTAEQLRERAHTGASLDDMLVEAFALVREVAQREIGLRPFDVQVIGGLGLYAGKIVEMQTGEGKTLAAGAAFNGPLLLPWGLQSLLPRRWQRRGRH